MIDNNGRSAVCPCLQLTAMAILIDRLEQYSASATNKLHDDDQDRDITLLRLDGEFIAIRMRVVGTLSLTTVAVAA